jgi:transposase-like protein
MQHNHLVCPKCKSPYMIRLERKGFIQTRVLPVFGFFPWKCYDCRIYRFMRVRGDVLSQLQQQDISR